MILRQSTAQSIRFGSFVDGADASLPETALTITQADMQLSKDGGAFAQKSAAGNATHDTDGWYSTTLSTTDTDTLGELILQVTIASVRPVSVRWQVVEEAIYDELYGTDASIADVVWDEILTGATHNIGSSSGRRLREIAGFAIREELAQGPGTGNNQIQLDALASAVDGTYDPAIVTIIDGTGIGQSRNILEYEGSTKTATVDRNWKTLPDATSRFQLIANPGREHVNEGLATGGTSTTITLNTLASSDDTAYPGQVVFIRSGTGEDQARRIRSYDGTTKIATVNFAWGTIPDSTSAYVMLPTSAITTSFFFDETLTEDYAADGVEPTLTQLLYLTMQGVLESEVVGSTLIVKKLDGVTTAATFTLNDASDPSSRTRSG